MSSRSIVKNIRFHLQGCAGAIAMMAASMSFMPVLSPAAQATPASYPQGKWEPPAARYDTVLEKDVPIRMDDGVTLRATIAYPMDRATGQRAVGKFPVILEHTPYQAPPKTYFVERGYIFVKVHARGTSETDGSHKSEGEAQFFTEREGRDSAALVNWASKLDGSDGRVAMLGCSWPGNNALSGAAFVGPNSPLKAVVASCIGLDFATSEMFLLGGAATQTIVLMHYLGTALVGNTNEHSTKFFDDIFYDTLEGGDMAYDRSFWKDRAPLGWAQKVVDNGVPVLLWAGYDDIVTASAFHTYGAFQNATQRRPLAAPMLPGQKADPRYQLIMGPWAHARGLDEGIMLQWIETWLKGADTGLQKTTSPMHLFEMGSGRWVNASSYPAVEKYTSWYLGDGGTLNSAPPAGAGEEKIIWTLPSDKDGRVNYTSPPLKSGMTLSGSIAASLYVSSSNSNMQLIPVLYDVSADGRETEITRGAILGSQARLDPAKSWTDADGRAMRPWLAASGDEYLTPGQVYRFDVLLSPRQAAIAPGHRIRLALTSRPPRENCYKADARLDPCLLTGPQWRTVPGGQYRIMHSDKYPSALNLPALPANHFPTAASGKTPTSGKYELPLDWSTGARK
ncbi:MAG: CocE/NonD family hydrolase [Sphingobium sp.]